MINTDIRPCSCVSVLVFLAGSGSRQLNRFMVKVPFDTQTKGAAYQDAAYGKGMRVHNLGKKTASCTVCGKDKPL